MHHYRCSCHPMLVLLETLLVWTELFLSPSPCLASGSSEQQEEIQGGVWRTRAHEEQGSQARSVLVHTLQAGSGLGEGGGGHR